MSVFPVSSRSYRVRLSLLLASFTVALCPYFVWAQQPDYQAVDYRTQLLVNYGTRNGIKEVLLLVAAKPGQSNDAARAIEQAGGVVELRFDDIGYIRAGVPLSQVIALAQHPAIEAVSIETEEHKFHSELRTMQNESKAQVLSVPRPNVGMVRGIRWSGETLPPGFGSLPSVQRR